MLCIFVEILSRAHAKGWCGLNYFKFGTFIGRFPNDGAASTAVKRLILKINVMHGTPIMTYTRKNSTDRALVPKSHVFRKAQRV